MKNDRVFILRESVVKITQMLSGKGIRVTQQGVNAYVKADHLGTPVLVNLPYLPDNATEELCGAIQGFLDHEVAHILFTEFALMSEANAKGGKQLGFLLNALEDPRIEKEMAKRFQGSAYNLGITGKFYLDKFVTPRLEEKTKAGDVQGVISVLMVPMIRAMSGQQVFKEFMRDKWGTVASVYERIEDLEPQIEGAKSTADCLAAAQEIVKRLKGDKSDKGDGESGNKRSKSKDSGSSKPKSKSKSGTAADESGEGDESSESEDGDKSSDSKDAGKSEGKSEKSEKSDKGESADDAKDADDSSKGEGDDEKEGEKEDNKEDDKKAEKSDDAEDEGDGSAKVDDEGDDEGDDEDEKGDVDVESEDESDDEDDGLIGEGKSPGESETEGSMEESELDTEHPIWERLDKDSANGYDESMSRIISESALKAATNADYLPFTKDYDVIEKLPVGNGYTPSMTTRLIDKVEHMVAPLQKDLERAIAARSLATRSHGHRSGRLHAANLSRLAVGDSRVFSRKQENLSKDVAVQLVVDASGSMSGSKIHTAAQAAYALSAVLERLNIKNEVICFTTQGYDATYHEMYKQQSETSIRFSRAEALYMPILKGYDERMSSTVKERFGWLPNASILRSNVDGECVEIAARRLMARAEKGKILIVLSDGYPAAAGSRGDLEQHLVRVVKDIDRAGVKVVGIGIQSDAVRKFYPKSLVLNDVEELPTAVIKELRHLLMQ